MCHNTLYVALAAVLLLVLCAYLYVSFRKATNIPGLRPRNKQEGNFPDIALSGSFHEFLMGLHKVYGDIACFWWGPQLMASIASPELFRQHSRIFDRPYVVFEMFTAIFGTDNFSLNNGVVGRRRFEAVRKCYTQDHIETYYNIFKGLSEEFLKQWEACAANGDHIPLKENMFAFGIKSMLRASYGRFFDSDKQVMALKTAYDYCFEEMEARMHGDSFEGDSRRFQKFKKEKAVMYNLVQQAMAYRREHPPDLGERLLIDAILEEDLEDSVRLQDLITVLIGGFHTTGLLLTWAFYYLAYHPDVQQKAYREICDVLEGEDVNARSAPHLTYLRQVLDETLRCSVLAPYAARVNDVDMDLGGYSIPAGMPVIQALGVVLQRPQLYPDPTRFDPDRFSRENCISRPPCSFEPFGFAGGRQCPGWRFSIAEGLVMITAILKLYEVKMVPGQVVTPVYGFVTNPKEEIWLTFAKR